jgi:hypothetical protein
MGNAYGYVSVTKFQFLTEASITMNDFRDVASCSLIKLTDVTEVLTASIIRAMIEAVSISEASFIFYETTRSSIQEDSHLHV